MSSLNQRQILKDVYGLIAELWCDPLDAEANGGGFRKTAEDVIERLESIDQESAVLLTRFLANETIAEEDYIDLFELDPQCALYLGSHSFDEPTTCANAAVSDRNGYMIELVGIYNHFGQKPIVGELPDYLPLMVDFLSLTAAANDDPVRHKFIDEYILPHLPAMHSKLAEVETPYLYLLEALETVMGIDRETRPQPVQREQEVEYHVG
jgi:nitrate reductase molybdenum cofactor assembly chaperone NarJ/NarW